MSEKELNETNEVDSKLDEKEHKMESIEVSEDGQTPVDDEDTNKDEKGPSLPPSNSVKSVTDSIPGTLSNFRYERISGERIYVADLVVEDVSGLHKVMVAVDYVTKKVLHRIKSE